MLRSVQFQQLNVTRKPRDEPRVGCRHDDWSLGDVHERVDGVPETTVVTKNNVDLQAKASSQTTQHIYYMATDAKGSNVPSLRSLLVVEERMRSSSGCL